MKYLIAIAISLFITLESSAQYSIYQGYKFPDTIPNEYIFNVKQAYQDALLLATPGVKKRDAKRYAEAVSYGKQELFTSGYVYIQWKELETYFNNVLQLVLPEELKSNKLIHIYPTRDPGYNAFTIHDGAVFLNIGLFADVENEAALAIIIGHEISHFLNDDVKNGYLKSLKMYSKHNRNNNYALKLNKAKFDRSVESKADSMGFILAENAGYDISYGISNYLTFKEIEQFEKSKKKNLKLVNTQKPTSGSDSGNDTTQSKSISDLLASHPDLTERIEYLKSFMNSLERKNGKQTYLVNQNTFVELQKKAKLESIYILLNSNSFKECAKRSFIYYLLDPQNDNYVYFLLESLRRLIYTDNYIKEKEFLSDEIKHNAKGQGILHSLKLLIPDAEKYKRIKDTLLLDTSKAAFETYEQAFWYFEDIVETRKIAESYLTLALYYNETDSLRNKYLNLYLASGNIKYREFAQSLLKNNLANDLSYNKRELVLFDNITFLEDHFYGYHDRLLLAEQKSPAYIAEMHNLFKKKFPEKDVIEIENLNYTDFKTKMDFQNIIVSSTYNKNNDKESEDDVVYFNQPEDQDARNKFDIFLLNPELWTVFKENGLKSIGYMKVFAFDDKTKILHLLNVINPCFWPTVCLRFYRVLFTGSSRFAHKIVYYSYDLNAKQSNVYVEEIAYKMSKAHFLNSVYFAIKSSKK